VDAMSAGKFFGTAAEILKLEPPHITDQPILAQMQRIDVVQKVLFRVTLDLAKAALTKGFPCFECYPDLNHAEFRWIRAQPICTRCGHRSFVPGRIRLVLAVRPHASQAVSDAAAILGSNVLIDAKTQWLTQSLLRNGRRSFAAAWLRAGPVTQSWLHFAL